jgi:excisionase family DNA binding protein
MLKNINSQPASNQTKEIKKLERILAQNTSLPKLLGATGEEIVLPQPVYEILLDIVRNMSAGQEISIVPINKQLTTQEAADLINVSRPYMIKLLDNQEILHSRVGTHRRILLSDLIAYKEQRASTRQNKLREMTGFLQEEGFYDYNGSGDSCD